MRGFLPPNIAGPSAFLRRSRCLQPIKSLCTNNTNNTNKAAKEVASIRDFDAYRQLDKLDFMTAAKILFTTPPKQKKFGLDFHLVQLFFVCMPSLAVYLVAQYARHEIKRMEAEAEVKRKQAEEVEKAKEMEELALEEEKKKSDPELLQVKDRLDALEEAIKGIVVESKKPSPEINEKEKIEAAKLFHGKSEDIKAVVNDGHPNLSSVSSKSDPDQKAPPAIDNSIQTSEKGKPEN